MRKLIFIFLILAAMAVNSQVIGKLTVGKLYAKDTVVLLSKGLKFADGTYLISATGIGDTIMTKTTSGGHGFVQPKYNTYPYISSDSGFAMMNRIFIKMGGTKASNKHSYYIGENTPLSSCIGQYNNVIGYYAGTSMADANHNNIMGYYAGASLYDGDYNIFLGSTSGYLTEAGGLNVFIGVNSGYSNVNGNDNVFIGLHSGRYLTAPSNWIILNTRNTGTEARDTTHSGLAIWQHDSTKYTRIYANGNLYVSDTLFYKDGTYSVTVPAGGGGLSWSDTNVIASKVFVAGKYATLALSYARGDTSSVLGSKTFIAGKYATLSGLSVYCLKSDTASLIYSRIRANEIFGTIASLALKMNISDTATLWASKTWANGRFALLGSGGGGTSYWELKAAGSGYILPSSSKKVILSELYFPAADTTYPALFIGQGGSKSVTIGFTAGAYVKANDYPHNVYIGAASGITSTGAYNTYVGSNTGLTGYGAGKNYNTYIGYGSGNTGTGEKNSFLGAGSGYLSTGDNNVFIGYYSAASATTASNNIYLGYMSGYYMTTENNRIILNSKDRSTKAGDSTLSPVYIYQAPTIPDQIFYMNAVLQLPLLASPPTVAREGMIYGDTDHHLYYHNGTTWVQLDN